MLIAIGLGLGLGLGGCAPCAPSANLRVELNAASGPLPDVRSLVVGLAINGGPRRVQRYTLDRPLTAGRALLLQPDAPIDGPQYMAAVDVTALGVDGTPCLSGRFVQMVGTSACNRLVLALAAP